MPPPYTDVVYWANHWWKQSDRAFKHLGYDFRTILMYYCATLVCLIVGGVFLIYRASRVDFPMPPRKRKPSNETVTDDDDIKAELNKKVCEQLAAGDRSDLAHFNKVKYDVQEESVFKNLDGAAKLKEQEVRQEQLNKIYELMQTNETKFGEVSMDDVRRQAGLYVK